MSPYIKTSYIIVFLFIFNLGSSAQAPSTCFEIESILVDACGSPEGANEMVRFVVGPADLNVSNLSVNWPNNSYKNICQNGTTASKVATLNSSIVGCGLLLEPTGGVLPAGERVILLTSTDFDVTANSFASLNDTLYVIFQCSGNTAGHFANYNTSPGLRTLSMTFSSPGGCTDAVTYERSDMINQSGGSGGPSSGNDGGTVEFSWAGSPTYINNGCTAPIEIESIDINETGFTICPGDTIDLSATIIGNFSSTSWNGGNGSFSSNSNSTTSYYSDATDNVDFYIYYEGQSTCSNPIKDSVLVQVGGNTSSVTISSSTTELCIGDSILLTATGTGNYSWSTGSSSNTIYASQAGTYSVTSSSSCGSAIDSILITDASTFTLNLTASETEICDGNTATLTASGAPNYTWFNSNTGTTEIVNSSGDYYVIGYNNCYTDSQSVFINVISEPVLSISSSDPTNELCPGETITLTVNGSDNYLWNTSDTSSSISVSTGGTYTVSTSNSCFNVNESITITSIPSFNLNLTASETEICDGNTATLTASGAPNYTWFNGNTGTSEVVNSSGDYYVIGYSSCSSDSQSVSISVITEPVLNLVGSSSVICNGASIILTASGSDNYLWNTSDTSSSISVSTAGTYSVSSSNSCFTVNESIVISNGALPLALITGDTILCNNEVTNLTVSGGDNYLWSTGSSFNNITVSNSQQGYVVAFNSCGSDTAYYNVADYSITASFTSNYVSGMDIPATINFNNTSINGLTFTWNFGTGVNVNDVHPSITYTETGEYLVSLLASNNYCSDSYETTLVFENPNTIYIPNVFTPNADGVNDVFLIKGENIASLECKIFNRWGEKLYSWNEMDGVWNGTYDNELVSDGTYFYILNVTWNNDEKETLTGHVTVLK